jgi:hypothetical protein
MDCDPADRIRRLVGSAIAVVGLAAALPAAAQDAAGDCTRFAFDARTPAVISRITNAK